ncbi:hypothetical protein PCANC_23127 [Puccinia coronata f. sp. avenae]|uniref:BED-type domain-containing protein n=1 Tax=Puccinia coronata f. sp. avenae TaxID=200324 RepID=A0A2N5U0G1_9BASI|nr:hypothetical protein PCANC_23127 [Puccinia coronata f. sp. avenae]
MRKPTRKRPATTPSSSNNPESLQTPAETDVEVSKSNSDAATATQTTPTKKPNKESKKSQVDTNAPNNQEADNPKKKQKRTSCVWEHFIKKGQPDNVKAVCKYCQSKLNEYVLQTDDKNGHCPRATLHHY